MNLKVGYLHVYSGGEVKFETKAEFKSKKQPDGELEENEEENCPDLATNRDYLKGVRPQNL